MMGEKKLKIADLARETGINRGTLTRLYNESAQRIEIEVLENLCQHLDCQVGELFEKVEN